MITPEMIIDLIYLIGWCFALAAFAVIVCEDLDDIQFGELTITYISACLWPLAIVPMAILYHARKEEIWKQLNNESKV